MEPVTDNGTLRILDLFRRAVYPVVHSRTPRPLLARRAVVVGAGGAGSWFSILFAMSADVERSRLAVVDADRLELVNANRLPYPLEWFMEEVPKVVAVYWYISLVRPGFEVSTYYRKLEKPEEVIEVLEAEQADLLVDAVDNVKSSEMLKTAVERSVDFLALHYDGYHGTIEWCPKGRCTESWVLDEEAGQGYTFPSTAAMPAILAALAVRLLTYSPDKPLTHSFEI